MGSRWVLRGVDLDVEAGSIVALVGPSGTGKSVLMKLIVGLLFPDAGTVRIDGHPVSEAHGRSLRRLRPCMGYAFQDGALLDSLTVRENLRLALRDEDCKADPTLFDRRTRIALARVNLESEVLDRLPSELSGGMRKRVGVARAIIHQPTVVLYDEPTTGLDPANVAAVHQAILQHRSDFGATSLVVSHDLGSLTRYADRVALLWQGHVRFEGTPEEFLDSDDPVVSEFIGSDGAFRRRSRA